MSLWNASKEDPHNLLFPRICPSNFLRSPFVVLQILKVNCRKPKSGAPSASDLRVRDVSSNGSGLEDGVQGLEKFFSSAWACASQLQG